MPSEIPQGTMCAKCSQHQATVHWYGDTTTMGWVHMIPEWWCECCAVSAQITHIKDMTKRLPELYAELEAACHTEGDRGEADATDQSAEGRAEARVRRATAELIAVLWNRYGVQGEAGRDN